MDENKVNKENLLDISNLYQICTKGTPKKYLKSAIENYKLTKHINKSKDKAFIMKNNM